jgi:hypothetical protein
MTQSFSTRGVAAQILWTAVFSFLCILSAPAQNAGSTTQISPGTTASSSTPAKAIGPPPAHTKQGQILDTALSSRTRQTLQEAMNSSSAADLTPVSK